MNAFQQEQRFLYPLTSLQIGDMQSYVSKLYLHVGKKKLIFFVDNGPWSAERSLRSKPIELWQFMVTQSRISPFANRSIKRRLIRRIHRKSDDNILANKDDACSSRRWNLNRSPFSNDQNHLVMFFRDLFQTRWTSVVQVQELSHLLHGCVTFELEWEKIRGINYINELQTDTCVALELKLLVKRDFCDVKEATVFYGLQHSDSEDSLTSLDVKLQNKKFQQKQSLESSIFDADEDFLSGTPSSDEMESVCRHPTSDSGDELYDAVCHLHGTAAVDSCCNNDILMMEEHSDLFLDPDDCNVENPFVLGVPDNHHIDLPAIAEQRSPVIFAASDSHHGSEISDDVSLSSSSQDDEEEDDFFVYRDTLLIYRFADPILPFELKGIITADQRLLKMLESGLPSWVIFLQSYPVFIKLYRPWMRPLAKTLFIMVSMVTVIIGFYDLYKNVPVLKAMAARLGGPFFEWIEAWEMVSRVKYLGTVVFLQNWEKAFRWLMLVLGTMRRLSNLIFQPLLGPLEEFVDLVCPVWNIILDAVFDLISLLSMICMSFLEYANSIVQLLALPLIWLLSAISSLVTWILYPCFNAIWGFVKLPIIVLGLLMDFIVAAFCSIYGAFQSLWLLVNSSSQVLSVSGPPTGKAAKTSASTLRLLWNDIFSQVFRAVRSILNVFVAFLTTCNRHRLSIYNRSEAFVSQLRGLVKPTPQKRTTSEAQALQALRMEEGQKRSTKALSNTASSRRIRKKVSLSGTDRSNSQ